MIDQPKLVKLFSDTEPKKNAPKKIAIYGAGGFGREVAWLLSTLDGYEKHSVIGYVEDENIRAHVLLHDIW